MNRLPFRLCAAALTLLAACAGGNDDADSGGSNTTSSTSAGGGGDVNTGGDAPGGAGTGAMGAMGAGGSGAAGGEGGAMTGGGGSGGSAGPGDTCADPIALPGAGNYSYDSGGFASDYTDYLGTCSDTGASGDGADIVFSIDLETGEILDLTVTPGSGDDPVLAVSSTCGDPINSCVVSADAGAIDDPEVLSYTNTSGAPQTIFLIADNYLAGQGGPFMLDVAIHLPVCGDGILETTEACDDGNAIDADGCTACAVDAGFVCLGEPSMCVIPPPGDICSDPGIISGTGTYMGSLDVFSANYNPGPSGCTDFEELGPDGVYAITLTAGQYVDATLTPGDSQDLALYLVTDCGDVSTSCVAGSDTGFSGDTESVAHSAAANETVYLIVDAYSATTGGPYALDVVIGVAGQGDTCANAIPITASGVYPGSFTATFPDYDPGASGCTMFGEPGNDVVYAVTPASSGTIDVTLTPSGQDLAVYVLSDCSDVTSCIEGSDIGFSGDAESISFPATAATTYYVIVDGYTLGQTSGAYTLDVTIN